MLEIYTIDDLKKWIKNDEGYNSHPYTDTTGHLTIAYGRNLTNVGVSADESELMFNNDYNKCVSNLEKYDWFKTQNFLVKCALINMCFNLGINGLLKFKKMILFLELHDYKKAADEALKSKWANQVGNRANEVVELIRRGAE